MGFSRLIHGGISHEKRILGRGLLTEKRENLGIWFDNASGGCGDRCFFVRRRRAPVHRFFNVFDHIGSQSSSGAGENGGSGGYWESGDTFFSFSLEDLSEKFTV